MDLLPLLTTFLICIFVNIELGILSGVSLSLFNLLFSMARPGLVARQVAITPVQSTEQTSGEVVVLEPKSGLAFPAVEYIEDKVMKYCIYEQPCKHAVLLANHITRCDYTTILGVRQICDVFIKHNLMFVIADCSVEVQKILRKSAISNLTLCDDLPTALEVISRGGGSSGSLSERVDTADGVS